MKNKVILGVFILLIAVLAASSAFADIDITTASVDLTGSSGMKTGSFDIKNNGSSAVNVSLSKVDPVFSGHQISIQNLQSLVDISAGATATVTFNVNTSAYMGAYTGGQITAAIDGVPPMGGSYDTVPVTVTVTDNGLGFSVIAPAMTPTPSDVTVTQTVTIQNYENKDITVTISKSGYDGMTFNIDKTSMPIPAFSPTPASVVATVTVPGNKAAGIATGTISVTDGTVIKTGALSINVQPTTKAGVSDFTISDVDPGEKKSVSFNIQNKGNTDIASLSLSNYTITNANGDKINLSFSPNTVTNLAVNTSTSVTANVDVSTKIGQGTYTQLVTLSGSVTQAFNVNVAVNSILQITDVSVDPDEVMPGEKFDVEVEVENTADNVDMRDVEVEVFIMDGSDVLQDDDDDDVKDSVDVGDLNDGDSEKVKLTFTMPYNTEDGDSFTIKVVAKGKNDDDTSQRYEAVDTSQTIDVKRDDHKVDIYKADLESSTLSCMRFTYIDVGLKDIGANDETVILTVRNDQLGIRVQDNFDMSSDYDDDDFEVEKSYQLDFTSAPPGTYPVVISAENEDGDNLGDKTLSVVVQDCAPVTPTAPTTPTTPTTPSTSGTGSTTGTTGTVEVVYANKPSAITGAVPAVSAATSISKAKGSWADTTLGIAVLVLGNLLLVLLVVIAIVYLVSSAGRKKETF